MIQCALDEDGCVDLLTVVRIMHPVGQEQAWGLAYELAALMQRLWPAGNCGPIENLAQIHIHRDGFVHEKSLLVPAAKAVELQLPPTPPISPELSETRRRRPALGESELVASLGTALFWTLDFGIAEDEERELGKPLDYLIFQSQRQLGLDEILALCTKRLPEASRAHAERHYRGVCEALVSETIKLSILLDKIYTATIELRGTRHSSPAAAGPETECDKLLLSQSELRLDKEQLRDLHQHHHHQHNHNHHHNHHHHHHHTSKESKFQSHHHDLSELGLPLASLRVLGISNWARLWMQVIKELRQHGKFK